MARRFLGARLESHCAGMTPKSSKGRVPSAKASVGKSAAGLVGVKKGRHDERRTRAGRPRDDLLVGQEAHPPHGHRSIIRSR